MYTGGMATACSAGPLQGRGRGERQQIRKTGDLEDKIKAVETNRDPETVCTIKKLSAQF